MSLHRYSNSSVRLVTLGEHEGDRSLDTIIDTGGSHSGTITDLFSSTIVDVMGCNPGDEGDPGTSGDGGDNGAIASLSGHDVSVSGDAGRGVLVPTASLSFMSSSSVIIIS